MDAIHNHIQSIGLSELETRLLSAILSSEPENNIYYIGEWGVELVGEPNLKQLPWIPKKVDNLQQQVDLLNQMAEGFNPIAEIVSTASDASTPKGTIEELNHLIVTLSHEQRVMAEQLDKLRVILKDMDNAINSLVYPTQSYLYTLYRVDTQGVEQLITPEDKEELNGLLLSVLCTSPSPNRQARAYLYNIDKETNTAEVLNYYGGMPRGIEATSTTIWQNINTSPTQIGTNRMWRIPSLSTKANLRMLRSAKKGKA